MPRLVNDSRDLLFSLGIAKYEAVLCGVPVKPRKSFGVLKSVVVHILVLLYHYIQSQTCVMLAFARKCDLRKGIGVGVVVAHSPVHSVLYAVVEVLLLVLDGAVRRHDVQVYSVIFGGFQHFFQIPGGSYVEEILPPAFKDHFGLDAAVVSGKPLVSVYFNFNYFGLVGCKFFRLAVTYELNGRFLHAVRLILLGYGLLKINLNDFLTLYVARIGNGDFHYNVVTVAGVGTGCAFIFFAYGFTVVTVIILRVGCHKSA